MKSRYHDLDRHESPHCEPKFLPFHWRQRTRAKPDRQNGSVTPSVGLQLLVFQQHTSIALPPQHPTAWKTPACALVTGLFGGLGPSLPVTAPGTFTPTRRPSPPHLYCVTGRVRWASPWYRYLHWRLRAAWPPTPSFFARWDCRQRAMRCRHPDACCFTPSQ